jgi:hypothetical protein
MPPPSNSGGSNCRANPSAGGRIGETPSDSALCGSDAIDDDARQSEGVSQGIDFNFTRSLTELDGGYMGLEQDLDGARSGHSVSCTLFLAVRRALPVRPDCASISLRATSRAISVVSVTLRAWATSAGMSSLVAS